MIENLEQLVRDNAGTAIINNPDLPNEQNEAAIQAASGSIFETLKNQISSGNISELVKSFTQNGANSDNPLVQQATSTFTDKLAGLGINAESAKNIGASLIPDIMGKFINKTNDPNDSSFNLQDVMGKLAGGADGKFDLSDVMGMFGGNQQSDDPNASSAGGGILGKIKGLFN